MDESEELNAPLPDETARKENAKPYAMPPIQNSETTRHRHLATDPSYPGPEVVDKIAEKLLDQFRLE